jgi:hypothetical protein
MSVNYPSSLTDAERACVHMLYNLHSVKFVRQVTISRRQDHTQMPRDVPERIDGLIDSTGAFSTVVAVLAVNMVGALEPSGSEK